MRNEPALRAASAKVALTAPTSKIAALWSGGVYTAAAAAPRVFAFLLLPLYTAILSPADYGQLSIALAAGSAAAILFALGLDIGMYRNVFQLESDPILRDRFIQSTWSLLMVTSITMALVVTIVLAPILGANHILSLGLLSLSLLGAALTVAATTVPLTVLRAQGRLRDYIVLNGIATLVTTTLIVVLVVWVRLGPAGWLWALIIGNATALVAAVRIVPYQRPRPFESELVRRALRLSLPLVPHYAGMWSLQLVDRLLVATILSTAATGIYSLASNVALPMMLVVLGFGQGFMPAYARAGTERNREHSLRTTILLHAAVVSIVCVACALLAPPAIQLLVNHRYAGAAELAPWIILGYAFLGLYQIPMMGISLTHGRTQGIAIISGAAAVTNIGLIVGLASPYGLTAVAIASAAGYGMLLLCVAAFVRATGMGLPYPWPQLILIVTIGAAGYAGGVLTAGAEAVGDVLIRLGWIVVTGIGIAAVLLGRQALRDVVGNMVRSET